LGTDCLVAGACRALRVGFFFFAGALVPLEARELWRLAERRELREEPREAEREVRTLNRGFALFARPELEPTAERLR